MPFHHTLPPPPPNRTHEKLGAQSLFIVRNIVEGGSAWRDGTIKLSDICVANDGTTMEDSRRSLSGEGATVWKQESGFLAS